jgi:polysaccharide pyruvyl transferase WcaK-like protein
MLVSVVVPTYATPQEGLDRLIASLDRQTMPAGEFEVIFVDDGSPDDTVARLRELASTRPHVRVVRLGNSGWPSKPRNHGTDLATGEYVAYVDHDDELAPDALRAAYAFAVANDADVVNGKEAYTHRGNWALTTYVGDLGQALDRTDIHPLLPMNPHKLYRRAFLEEHGIRFREGRKVLWEDILFNIQVGRHARVVSTLSSVPYYHWAEVEGSGSTQFTKWADDYWAWLREVIATAESELAEPRLAAQREQVIRHQYVGRVIRSFDAGFARRPDEARRFIFDQARALQADFGLDRFDSSLTAAQRARARLLREDRLDLITRLCADDPQPAGRGTAASIRWEDGLLRVEADVAWADPKGRRHATREGDRLVRSFPAEVEEALTPAQRDITDEVAAASIELAVRSRADRFVWLAPSTDEIVAADGDDGAVSVSGTVRATIDPETAAMGRPLSPGYWDLLVRARLSDETNARALASDLAAGATVTAGRLHLVYPNDGGAATLFVDGAREAVRRLRPVSARLTDRGELEITLDGTHDGAGEVATTVGIDQSLTGTAQWAERPATLAVDGGRAVLRFVPGGDRMRVRVGDRAGAKGSRTPWLAVSIADGTVVYGDLAALDQNPRTRVLLLTNRDSDNVGDQLIEASAISLVKGVMKNLGVAADGFTISSRAAGIVPKAYLASRDPSLLEDARKAIANADILLFGGAPLFNYTYQKFYLRTIITLELAQEYGVPVLFSSIGVEPFDETNAKSLALRKALELPCVRQITTRDDLASVERYVENTGIPVAHVSDPAVFANLVFGVDDGPREGRTIGLVVTREGIFKDNGISFSASEQRRFWLDVIDELTARGYDYTLFTTGHFSDEVFLDAMVKAKRIPAGKVVVTVNSPEELNAALGACAGVIAFRLHASIASFSYGIPSVGLSWNFKVPYFYESVGHGDRALDHTRWTAAEVVPALERAMAEGVRKDEAFLMTVYETLFNGFKSIVAPDSDKAPYTYDELRAQLPRYGGTTEAALAEKVRRKLRRTYESYYKLSIRAAKKAEQPKPPSSGLRKAVSKALPKPVKQGLRKALGRASR